MENPHKTTIKKLAAIALFVIAFAYIESSVVVYLREIFYPDGFTFPLTNLLEMPGAEKYLLVEIGREAATIVLILTVSFLSAGNWRHRLAYFLIIFAVWDIFYYLWLKVLINWPASMMDWDILFLIPFVWAGPVLAPVITSLTMLITAALLLGRKTINLTVPRKAALIIMILMIIILYCFAGWKATQPNYQEYFSWPIFGILHIAVMILLFQSAKRSNEKSISSLPD